jgi:hypothetical protein
MLKGIQKQPQKIIFKKIVISSLSRRAIIWKISCNRDNDGIKQRDRSSEEKLF